MPDNAVNVVEQEIITPPGFNIPPNMRVSQTGILPTAIKIRTLGDVIILGSLVSGSATLSNGDETTFSFTVASVDGARNLCIPDVALYVGSVAAANQLPSGSSITESQWEVIFMGNDWATTDNFNSIHKVYVRNISAGASQSVLLRSQARVITNSNI